MLEINLHSGITGIPFKMVSLAPRPVVASHVGVCHYQGKIYAVGGLNGTNTAIANFHVYDIATNSWTALPNRPRASRSAAVGAANGKIYVYGGNSQQNNNSFTQVDVFNIATNTWSAGPASTGRADAGNIVIGEELYIFGGAASGGGLINTNSKLKMSDPVGWSTLPSEAGFRYTGTLYVPEENAIYLAGAQLAALATTHKRYNIDTNTFETLEPFPVASHSTAGFYSEDDVVFYSAYNNGYSSKIYRFDRVKNEWKEELMLGNGSIHGLPGAVQVGEELYLIGGFNGGARHNEVSKIIRNN